VRDREQRIERVNPVLQFSFYLASEFPINYRARSDLFAYLVEDTRLWSCTMLWIYTIGPHIWLRTYRRLFAIQYSSRTIGQFYSQPAIGLGVSVRCYKL